MSSAGVSDLSTHHREDEWGFVFQGGRVHRSAYTDEAIFRREMANVFGSSWVFVGHESEVPNNNSFVTRNFGGRPVILTRDGAGELNVLFNRCAHRGAKVCRQDKGTSRTFVCPYHSWSYDYKGHSVGVPMDHAYEQEQESGYFDLLKLPKVTSYRGFVFGSLNNDIPTIEEYLGGVRGPLDEWIDRYNGGEIRVSGIQKYRIEANWKFITDNQGDGYHPAFSHRSLLRMSSARYGNRDMQYFGGNADESAMFAKAFTNGHYYIDQRPEMHSVSAWDLQRPQPGREYYEQSLREKYGAEEAQRLLELAVGSGLNLTIFPNLLVIGNQFQLVDPLSVGSTDLYWFATRVADLPDEINTLRVRTQEDFPMLGEVDDVENFEQCQAGLAIGEDEWIDCSRHLDSAQEVIEADGIKAPVSSDITMRTFYKEWQRLMRMTVTTSLNRQRENPAP